MRATEHTSKVFYKGASDDFIVFVDDPAILKKWKTDRSISLTDVVNGYKIFVTHKHGSQGVLDGASNASLDNEFGTHNVDDCIVKILEKGEYQTYAQNEHQGDTNFSNGPAYR
ncbi:SBDS family protein [Aspergillus clavatus NRRL 1]|uniref:Ribosome maturation protein SDO1/SBDS N-terminal domain-containing protein n=1 Tax=Aspergillus clavatus (strain ATCC 1007 / CBS 513.65 / DSM 816 / NCTC 3887 / NRRL 1 / QM 1276 / 107) TaxID=344612 RepID=A1CUH2_ASPCL|nr:uncharacterized protein ACLA_086580 [Aspergillus clavatus NRRL 1]EAW06959.1 conserved hypothetical protein [Aspergillus clavatus NRRL 1]